MKTNTPKTICGLLVLVSLTIISCKNTAAKDSETLANADRYFSSLSIKVGRNAAFLAMFDSAGVMLGSNLPPVEGYKAISKLLVSHSDSTYTLTWEPMFAKVAKSGELGYTYGIYKLSEKKSGKKMSEGTYTTIWQKNAKGEWKAMLDTGNEGLKQPSNK